MAIGDEARRTGVEARVGGRADRTTIEPDIGPTLPDRLVAARERKGVDLFRAERDTKIRARYLAALERGDYRELPGAVYTKGFLRNYAIYLNLDPEDVLRQWRRERGDQVPSEPAVVAPKAILEAPRPLTFSPSIVVAALMTFGVILFGVYLAVQLLRFAKPPVLEVTRPATAVAEVDEAATTYRLVGTSTPGATVTVEVPGRSQPYRVTALSDGSWSVDVDLRRGTNQFDINAVDPETGKPTETPRRIVITVPYLVIQAPTLTVAQPVDETTFENGAIPVEGMTTNARTVVVRATYLGPPDGSTPPTPAPTPVPTATPVPDPSASAPPEEPDGVTVEVAEDGSFATPLELTEGRWSITITATSPEGKTASLTRTVTVAYEGVNLVVTIQGGNAWLKVWVDGVLDPSIPQSGQVFQSGRTLTFRGTASIEVRTGSSGFTQFTLNGVPLGALGRPGIPETWLFQPPAAPQLTQRR
ncbi:MAG TPA: helix-turn-helix domain-containing protein [Candidatus Limnocylindrales bacterium]|nr:helix-turn-helix domain-containing protein [Candidatus Limnocylindrales bacterium]